jgi:hypothetical protein
VADLVQQHLSRIGVVHDGIALERAEEDVAAVTGMNPLNGAGSP